MSNIIKFPETDKERQDLINKFKSDKEQQEIPNNNEPTDVKSCGEQTQISELIKCYTTLLQSKISNQVLEGGQLIETLLLGKYYNYIKDSDVNEIFSDVMLRLFSVFIANTDYNVEEFCERLKEL